MESIIIHPAYFGNIAHYVAMAQAKSVVFEVEDNYQKQTFRNRTYIATANGVLLLNIPIKHISKGLRGSRDKIHQKYKEVRIENDFKWQKEHWKSIQIAYRSSPYFEYYEDDIAPLFEKKQTFLMDFNLECFAVIADLLTLEITTQSTSSFELNISDKKDFRFLVETKGLQNFTFDSYTQVLQKEDNFLPNLSILDLLFNEGTRALSYLEKQKL
ncbi:MAG: hypothetical protein CVU03_02585 [Bacteroidetes bacterium HGW-Bacteroidetes-2]|nr:MAG: hypothetical protein CVU13_05730 [Bacteroidetes bacterium HGW-Bacteroidetes-8]PKP26786.1 MAG: hypothetical protein CVU03_02585 [Bacteroidetes bacterium HGW-Bacteroidetes-2]